MVGGKTPYSLMYYYDQYWQHGMIDYDFFVLGGYIFLLVDIGDGEH